MRTADRRRLLFGPYRPPPVARGDRACCLRRACRTWTGEQVVIDVSFGSDW
jgi:hypothetical protein